MALTEGGRAGLGFGAKGMLRGDRGLMVYGRESNPCDPPWDLAFLQEAEEIVQSASFTSAVLE
jgi:hypothetical protein